MDARLDTAAKSECRDGLPKRGRGILLIFTRADLAKPALRAVASLVIVGALSWVSTGSRAADLPSGDGYAFVAPVEVAPSGWQFRVTHYAWAPSVNGDVTVRGHTADIDMSFWDLFDSGSSGAQLDSLAALERRDRAEQEFRPDNGGSRDHWPSLDADELRGSRAAHHTDGAGSCRSGCCRTYCGRSRLREGRQRLRPSRNRVPVVSSRRAARLVKLVGGTESGMI